MSFQTRVNLELPLAIEGDFASANPRAAVLTSAGGFIAGVGGVVVGKFAWVASDGRTVHNHGTYPQAPDGFVHRDQQGLITAYLQEHSMLIPEGFPVTLLNQGDFWVKVAGSIAATRGAAVYADYSDGSTTIGSAATGASATGSIGATTTGSIGATFTATADTDPTRLVVTSVTGLISLGEVLSGTGITAGTTVDSQVSGTTGGAGTYQLSAANTASSATVTSFGTVLKITAVGAGFVSIGDTVSTPSGAKITSLISGTGGASAGIYRLDTAATAYTASGTVTTFGNVVDVTAIGSGSLRVGDPITGTGVPASSVIASQVSGTIGGIGFYTISNRASAYAASTTLTTTGGVLTTFKAESAVAVGELTKITTWS